MNYAAAANKLFELRGSPIQPGPGNTERLLDHLGNPETDVEAVQITGSNGKGSTARMTERALREAGYDVGLYTSPHLDDFRERVRIDGRKISKRNVCEYVEAIEPHLQSQREAGGSVPTFFEAMTGLALWEFARRRVDVAVLEVGVGGRTDATSAVEPVASAVTSVSLDHTDYLGETVTEIATEKAHVAPEDGPLVTAADGDALNVIESFASEVVTVGQRDDVDVRATYEGQTGGRSEISLDGPGWSIDAELPLLGAFQASNAGVAAGLVRAVANPSAETIARGFEKAHWPGRCEVVQQSPTVLLDSAHNPEACRRLAAVLEEFAYDDLHVVYGAAAEKDHASTTGELPHPDRVVTCEPNRSKIEPEDTLVDAFEELGVRTIERGGAVVDAVDRALEATTDDDLLLVTGSLYTVREARRWWSRLAFPRQVDSEDAARKTLRKAGVPTEDASPEDLHHEVLKVRAQLPRAEFVRDAMRDAGGQCWTSGIEEDRETVDVVLAGSRGAFDRLTAALADADAGVTHLVDRIETVLDSPGATGAYPWTNGTAVMGILNVTPDSFHDGGEYYDLDDAVERAERMVESGADVVDVGGESTRPGADPVPPEEEIDRIVPVIESIADVDALISVDTRNARVAEAALDAGADLLNDVSGLEDPQMARVAAEHDAPVVIMHSIDTPVDPDLTVEYDDVVDDVIRSLHRRIHRAERAGLDRDQIVVDPGLGFGKSNAENFELLDRLPEFRALGCPVLVGHSHKSMFGHVNCPAGERHSATVAATSLAVDRGANVVRVHDVAENADAVRVAEATGQGADLDERR